MQRHTQHIAAVLLAVFLYPQLAKGLHYLLVEHQQPGDRSYAFTETEPDLRYHSCAFHLHGFLSFLPVGTFSVEKFIVEGARKPNLSNPKTFTLQPDFHFQLRGPPLVSISLATKTPTIGKIF